MANHTSDITTHKQDIDALVEPIYQHYRSTGFPFYRLTPAEKYKQLQNLLRFDHSRTIAGKTVEQKMHGLALAWSYFPHAWSVRCNDMKTPIEVFECDSDFRRAIVKRLKYGTGRITDAAIRKAVRTFSGAQAVSNFRPTAAAAIYHTFLPASGGTVWDMSSGYGGRLLGAMACSHVSRYIGTDPCPATMDGLRSMAMELGRDNLKINLNEIGSEEFSPESSSLDVAFTSPPYFNAEKYGNEPTQSYLKYPERTEWLHGFVGGTLENCRRGLKPTGRLIINIANVKSYPTLERDFVTMAVAGGWKLERTLRYALSKMMGTRRPGSDSFKYEPIFIFRRR